MARDHEAGFTLIEIMLVMAISGMLLVMAFVGQRGVRSRARFDEAVNKIVASIDEARNEATSSVNLVGSGDGSVKCAGGPNPGDPAAERYIFAGTALVVDNAQAQPLKMNYYKALSPDGGTAGAACSFDTKTITLSSDLSVTASGPTLVAGQPGALILYVRTNNAELVTCVSTLAPAQNELLSFQNGTCESPAIRVHAQLPGQPASSATTVKLTFRDSDGHSSRVDIDGSGLAVRAN